jgi:hypothetical protein
MSLTSLYRAFDRDPLGCWIDLHCHNEQWSIVLGPKHSRQGTVYPLNIGEVRRFLRFAIGPANVKTMIDVARASDETGWPLGIPIAVQLEAA